LCVGSSFFFQFSQNFSLFVFIVFFGVIHSVAQLSTRKYDFSAFFLLQLEFSCLTLDGIIFIHYKTTTTTTCCEAKEKWLIICCLRTFQQGEKWKRTKYFLRRKNKLFRNVFVTFVQFFFHSTIFHSFTKSSSLIFLEISKF
jgi:hypothetical protein